MNLIVNHIGEDPLLVKQKYFTTFEGSCPRCEKPRGEHTLIGTRLKHLSSDTMKVWLKCIACNGEITMKCKVT